MSNDYIAVFDSGIGGLTVVKALKELLPQENIIYFGDTFNMPYGEKTISQIKQFSIDNINFLSIFKPKAYVVACGTMSGNAMDEMINAYTDGCEIVYGVRKARKTDTFFKRTTAEGFYKFLNFMGAEVVFNHADYRLIEPCSDILLLKTNHELNL